MQKQEADKCRACGMPLENPEDCCACDPTLCYRCCKCPPECRCGCAKRVRKGDENAAF